MGPAQPQLGDQRHGRRRRGEGQPGQASAHGPGLRKLPATPPCPLPSHPHLRTPMLGSSRAHTRPMLAAGVRGPRHSALLPGFPLRLWGRGACRLTVVLRTPISAGPLSRTRNHPESLPEGAAPVLSAASAEQWARGQGLAGQRAPCFSFRAPTPRRCLPRLRRPSLPAPDKRRRPRDGGTAQGHRVQLRGIPVVKAEPLGSAGL